MADPRSEDLWFLAPGLQHQLANALFAAQGQLQMAALDDLRTRPVIDALRRAQGVVAVLRHLLPGGGAPIAVGAAVHTVAELVRVPLRDRGLRLVTLDPAPGVADASSLVPALVTTVRHVAAAIPFGLAGSIGLVVTADDHSLRLRWRVDPAPGQLPFRLDWSAVAARLGAELPPGAMVEAADRDAMELSMPPARRHATEDSDGNLR